MRFANRIAKVPPYPFVQISRKIAEKRAQGIEVLSFGIGDPDLPTPDPIIESVRQASLVKQNHRYPESEGLPDFRKAVADWYKQRFGVVIDPEKEATSLIGAKEGIGHMAFAFLDPGDIALVPDPGYPVYAIGTLFSNAVSHLMPLSEKNGWLPDLDAIPEDVARKAKVLWLNYPNNPTSAVADIAFFEKAIAFAKKYDIAVLHDACYTEVYYDGYRPVSFLQAKGAKDVGIEFHSLSKSYNMTGWRIGMAVGNAEIIKNLLVVKSNLDSGVSQAVQQMAITAMKTPQSEIDKRNLIYQSRRDRVVKALQQIGVRATAPKASLYIWAGVPKGFTSAEFAERLLEDRNVLVTPGSVYGKSGEGYIRLSLTISEANLEKALERISTWKVPAPKVAAK
ncbi:MAG: aminotransferase class I/II-fold pyridoxal phosphate-dependent enzyme [SAR202 cluster bacterium]|nr:aminotransferase class I/II-fold pyridoxal phosphate-dependent enzyme [SAR202 cluster bacterium]